MLQLHVMETLILQPNNILDTTRKEVNTRRVQPNMLKSYKGYCNLEILIVSTN